jgi:exopolyphosphatase/guanosine-5'-triphosphate,3'-diphosphate pyrophosphatase
MINKQPLPSFTDTEELPFEDFIRTLDWIIMSSQSQRDLNPHIIPIRRKMAPIAAIKTRWVIQQLGIQKIVVSPCSLKEGVLQS